MVYFIYEKMVINLPEKPATSLPPVDPPVDPSCVLKIKKTNYENSVENQIVAERESNASFTVSSASSSTSSSTSTITTSLIELEVVEGGLQRWNSLVLWIITRAEVLDQYIRYIIDLLAERLCCFMKPIFKYKHVPVSEESTRQLENVQRKSLVLDLDETLIHSCYIDADTNEHIGCAFVPETAVPDYSLVIPILKDKDPIPFRVFKRPHVDLFLDVVSKWYDLVIYTASMEEYASIVVDRLDNGRGILRRRFYRQHCMAPPQFLSKNLLLIDKDLANVFIIDNSPTSYRSFPDNAIPIKSYIYDLKDEELLNLLPFLDALRFTKDVRSVLSRRTNN